MKIIRMIAFMLAAMMICVSGGCSEDENGIKVSDSGYKIHDLVSRIYTESELSEMTAYKGTIFEFDENYPIECIRKNYEHYTVSYLGENKVLIATFDSNGDFVYSWKYNICGLKSDFDAASAGWTIEQIIEIDPNGTYLFLYTGNHQAPFFSTHCTEDGYMIKVEYDCKYHDDGHSGGHVYIVKEIHSYLI